MIPPEVEKISADYLAIQAYYTRLAEQAEQAIRGNALVPVIPPRSELEVVDGWVVWKGRPVWSAHDNTLADAQSMRTGRTPMLGQSAWVQATEERLDATLAHLGRAEKYVTQGSKPPEVKARLMAKIGFYRSLVEQQRLAIHGKAATPELPDESELEFVDGWLVWKGQPVWWSGYRPDPESVKEADHPAQRAPAPPPRSATEARPRRRHLFRLPWQRAA